MKIRLLALFCPSFLLALSAYVTNIGSNTVSVFDTETGEVVKTIEVGRNPLSLTIQGQYAYVANAGEGTVSVIDLVTNQVVDTIWIVQRLENQSIVIGPNEVPSFIAVSDQLAYVTNYAGDGGLGSVSVIDLTTRKVTATITDARFNGPQGLVVSGNEVFVANWGAQGHNDGSTVSVIDRQSNRVIDDIFLGEGVAPRNLAIGGDFIYVVNNSANNISMIRIADHAVLHPITDPSFNHPIAIAISGDYVYVTNGGSHTLSVIDRTRSTVAKVLDVSASQATPYGVAINGNLAYVTNTESDQISIVDVIANTYSVVTDAHKTLSGPTWVVSKSPVAQEEPVQPVDEPVWVKEEPVQPVDEPVWVQEEPIRPADEPVWVKKEPEQPVDDPVWMMEIPVQTAAGPLWVAQGPVWVTLFSTNSIANLTAVHSIDRVIPIYQAELSKAKAKLRNAGL